MAESVALRLSDLVVKAGATAVVDGVDLELRSGRVTALVGMSGCGKTTVARALLGLVEARPGVVAAELEVAVGAQVHRPYAALGDRRARRAIDRAFAPLRGSVLGYVPQDARGALDPLWTVGAQVRASARPTHGPVDALRWLTRAGLDDAERVASLHPHELSGGMAQRVVIAQALACGSSLLIADEPTTGLDPIVQAGVLAELRRLADDEGVGALLVTHDLRVLQGIADDVLVMDAGKIVERTSPSELRGGALRSPAALRLWAATRRVSAGVLG